MEIEDVWVDTDDVNLRSVKGGRRKEARVTFRDPCDEVGSTATKQTFSRENTRIGQRSFSEPATTTTIPSLPRPRPPQALTIVVPIPPTQQSTSVPYNNRTPDRLIPTRFPPVAQPLLYHQRQNQSSTNIPPLQPAFPFPTQPTYPHHSQPQIPSRSQRAGYHARIPSVEHYDRAHWNARITDLERGGQGTHGLRRGHDGEEDEGCDLAWDGKLFVQFLVGFLVCGGLVWGLYGR